MGELKLGTKVKLALSDEEGVIIGRAEYAENSPQYYVRYKMADGCQAESWFNAGALKFA